jgi:hypothetical protein
VVRAALQGAASIAGLLITEAMVAELPRKQVAGPAVAWISDLAGGPFARCQSFVPGFPGRKRAVAGLSRAIRLARGERRNP